MRWPALLLPLLFTPSAWAAPDLIRDRTPLESFARNVAGGGSYEPGEVLLSARSMDALPLIAREAEVKRCKLVRTLGRRPLALFRCDPRVDMFGLFAFLQDLAGVRWVEASYYEQEEAAPDDLDANQWYHQNSGQPVDGQAGLEGADIGSLDAWDITTGSDARVILINDVGIYPDHVDMQDQIWVNEDEDCTNGIDDDGNGYVDDCRGYDFADDDNDPDPSSLPEVKDSGAACLRWHATMIAGLAGARGNNGAGITGVNWNVKFMNVKKHRDSSCVSTTSRSIEAVLYAADNGADVVSMSFSSSNYNATFEAALQEAERKGVVAVSSGGNGNRNNDQLTRYPNEYDVDASIIIGSSTHLDTLYEGANFGANSIDIAAPGANVLSTSVDAPYAFSYGTGSSYAAGFAAGAVTLVRSAFPDLTALEVADVIKEGAERVAGLSCANTPRCVRLGARLDTWGALQRAAERRPAALELLELRVEESGDGDGILEAGELALLRPVVANSGSGAAFRARVRVRDGISAFTVDRAETVLGDILAGSTSDPGAIEPLVVSIPAECTASSTVDLVLEFSDGFSRTWTGTSPLTLGCRPGSGGGGAGGQGERENPRPEDAAGCAALHPSAGAWWVLGVLALGSRRRRRR